MSTSTVSHITLTVEAPTLEQAWSDLKAKITDGYAVVAKKIDTEGGPTTLSAEGETIEAAASRAREMLPKGALGAVQGKVTDPAVETIEARGLIKSVEQDKISQHLKHGDTLRSFKVKAKPKNGFLGIGRREGIFEAVIAHLAKVEYAYSAPARVSAFAVNFVGGLTGARLGGAELPGFDLSRMDLSNADLSRANLYRTNLGGAKLRNAKLDFADLTQANLQDADLTGCSYTGAKFDYAAVNPGTKYPTGFVPFFENVWVRGLLGRGSWDHWSLAGDAAMENIFSVVQWSDEASAVDEIRKLIHKDSSVVNRKTDSGATPLFYAVLDEKERIAALLVESGADPNAPTINGNSPLKAAMQRGNSKMIAILRRS